jgi:hypothetical protein
MEASARVSITDAVFASPDQCMAGWAMAIRRAVARIT